MLRLFFTLLFFFPTHSSSFAERHLSLQFPSLLKKTCVGAIPQCACALLLIPAFVIWLTGTEHSVNIKVAYIRTHLVIVLWLQIITSQPDSLHMGNFRIASIIEKASWSINKACKACKSSIMSLNNLWRNQATLFGIAFLSLHLHMPDQDICLAQHLLYGQFTWNPIVQNKKGMH